MFRTARRFAVPAIVSALALATISSAGAEPTPSASSASVPERSLSVMTYNIGQARGLDGNVSVHRAAHRIRETGADIVALQEVDVYWALRSDLRDQATELAELLDMHLFFAPIYSFDPDFDPEGGDVPAPPEADQRAFGLAVLSKYPIVSATNHEMTRRVGRGPHTGEVKPIPGFADVTVSVTGVPVRILNVHLQAGASQLGTDIRTTQVAEILDVVGDNPENTLLFGDLNAAIEQDSPVYRPEILPLFGVLNDAWDAGEGDGFTFRASDPDRRIDFILPSPDVMVSSAEVVDSDASDHRPVLATITVIR